MIKYILNNKEWIFSGIGVLFFSGFIILIRYLIPKIKKFFTPANDVITEDSEIENNQKSDISQFDVPSIMKSFDDVPPVQLEENLKKFVGLNINWTATYSSAYKKTEDSVRISLDLNVNSFRPITLWCEVNLSEYNQLNILKKNTQIRIIGEIAKFEVYHIELSNVTLIFLDQVVT